MKNKICLFAGTAEGHRLARFLGGQDIQVTISVATEYGAQVLEQYENETILHGKMPVEDMIRLFEKEKYDLVIDATHPYASHITGSISHACGQCAVRYLRLKRNSSEVPEDAVAVPDAASAAQFLDGTSGNILFTTGSKDLPLYKNIRDFARRAFARVLPFSTSLESCSEAGLAPSNIIAMQGPFSAEMNLALLRSTGAKWLVTKETSDEGGFYAKADACRQAGARMVVIGRPEDVDGSDYSGVIRILCDEFGCVGRPEITIAGIGPGSFEMMTEKTVSAISSSECLIGAKRMINSALEQLRIPESVQCFEAVDPVKISEYIRNNPQFQKITVLMSGDTGFFSGTKKLAEKLEGLNTEIIPGISSLSYLCSRVGISYEDVKMISLHGRDVDICRAVRRHRKVFALTGGTNDAGSVCRRLTAAGLGAVKVSVGEKLSYSDERIVSDKACALADVSFDPLSAMIIENEAACAGFIPGIPDNMFDRGGENGKIVPMTKSEIRAVCMSKLNPSHDAVCWDIGAGTGSVSVEMALAAYEGRVYAVEKRKDAVQLLERNIQKFGIGNISVTEGSAPEVLEDLPAPTHVFIGGSSGNIKDIIETVFQKNSEARIVATAVSLEGISELTKTINELAQVQSQVTAVNISRDSKAGSYHLMSAQNPIYIFEINTHQEELIN